MDFESIKSNHALHAVAVGILTTILLKNKTEKSLVVGTMTGLALYLYMSNFGHSLPMSSDHMDGCETNNTVYKNPSGLLNTYSATS